VAQQWLASNPKKRPSTWGRDEAILRLHVLPVLGKRAVGTMSGRTYAL
jgi:hypothetical protein